MMSTIPVLAGPAVDDWMRRRTTGHLDEEARAAVDPILTAVRDRGDVALREFTQRFDRVAPGESLEADREQRRAALSRLTPDRRGALERAWHNIVTFHESQSRDEPRVEVAPGLAIWREFRPIEHVGIYVPGGRAEYPSSVLMCAVPARLAGCRSIIVCVPPNPDGRAPESVMAAAELVGVDNVFTVGGAQAKAAKGFGTETVPRVDKIFGPGNRFVTAAKERVYGIVDIDMPAGPSEIVILADAGADPRWVAADLVSQAEHAPDVLAACITTDAELARAVADHVDRELEALPDAGVARESLAASAVCVATSEEAAVDWVNRLAPEHLEIVTRDPERSLHDVDHAGSVFLGPYAPVAAGDYATGASHVLPTAGRARAWAALSLDDFGRWMQVQRLTRDALAGIAETVTTLARWEGLEAHARAVELRLEKNR